MHQTLELVSSTNVNAKLTPPSDARCGSCKTNSSTLLLLIRSISRSVMGAEGVTYLCPANGLGKRVVSEREGGESGEPTHTCSVLEL